jgi:hypothetical protein
MLSEPVLAFLRVKAGSLLALACVLGACRAAPPDELYVLADVDVESVDPHAFGGRFSSRTVLTNVYEGLVARDAELRIRPALAVSWSNPDDHTWDFVLRPGVRFHDGSTLVAQDVVDSIRRAQQHPRSVVRGDLANVSEVSAPDAATVRLRTREPDAALLSLLPEVFVMSGATARAATELEQGSQGTGPYRPLNASPRGSQNGSVSPSPAKISTISAGPGRRDSGCRRVPYQAVARPQSCFMLTIGRTGMPSARHQSRTRSSDRKKSMRLQVNTRSSHHCAAGTAQWKTQSDGGGPADETSRRSGAPDCPHRDVTSAARPSAAGMPSASHAQFAK